MTTDTEARELLSRLFGYQVRTGHTIQSGAGTKAPTLIWADADYEVGDGLCGLHPDQKQANEPSIPYARIDALLALLAENERLREALEACVSDLESFLHDQYDGVWLESDFDRHLTSYRAALKGVDDD